MHSLETVRGSSAVTKSVASSSSRFARRLPASVAVAVCCTGIGLRFEDSFFALGLSRRKPRFMIVSQTEAASYQVT